MKLNSLCSILFHLLAGWEVADSQRESGLVCESLQFVFPESCSRTVAPAAISGAREGCGVQVRVFPEGVPPSPDALDGELCSIAINAKINPAAIMVDVVHAVGYDFSKFGDLEIVNTDFFWLSFRAPCAPVIFEISHNLLFLCVNADDRFASLLLRPDVCIDELELCVAIRMACAFEGFLVGL